MKAWLRGELEEGGIDITQELDHSLMPTSPLRQMLRRFSGSAYTGPEAASRTIADLVLLEAVSILNGTTRKLREQTTTGSGTQSAGSIGEGSSLGFSSQPQLTTAKGGRTNLEHERRENFENLRLFWEVSLGWSDAERGRSFGGRVDWGIGFPIGEEMDGASLSTTHPDAAGHTGNGAPTTQRYKHWEASVMDSQIDRTGIARH